MTYEVIYNDMVKAWKSGDTVTKSVLSDVLAHLKRAAIDKGCRDNMSESFVDTELLKVNKMFKEMVDTCPPERVELRADYERNFAIVSQYVPKLINNKDDILALIRDNYDGPLTKKDLMKFFSGNYKGKVDMKVVNQVVSEVIA